MTLVVLAQDLLVQVQEQPPSSGFYVGSECSRPVAMPPRAIVRLALVVQQQYGSEFDAYVWLQGSNDLSTWHTVQAAKVLLDGQALPATASVGAAEGVAVPFAYARAQWVLDPLTEPWVLEPGQAVLITAVFNATSGGES